MVSTMGKPKYVVEIGVHQTLIGPFDTPEAAKEYAETQFDVSGWAIRPIYEPFPVGGP